MSDVKIDNGILIMLTIILGGFLLTKFLGTANEESWEISRDKDGRLLSIKVNRNVKNTWIKKRLEN